MPLTRHMHRKATVGSPRSGRYAFCEDGLTPSFCSRLSLVFPVLLGSQQFMSLVYNLLCLLFQRSRCCPAARQLRISELSRDGRD